MMFSLLLIRALANVLTAHQALVVAEREGVVDIYPARGDESGEASRQ
ncbi:hypothetical protein I540_2750 [Mycobacteroides abscessus subsp. bolletii 1513]|uniref:Uncharacterized protein n=1 Tax=Mycobacteroides abscessus subsp. bolletii 1513 TaxID=1299321 RepID=X8DW22_9MYCO|nr:hypothetical protein I540_2750 [Mycobacteroides abscessus subsp. bolletii 1513]